MISPLSISWHVPVPLKACRAVQLTPKRTTYLHALSEMPRQMHQDPKEVLKDGCIIHTVRMERGKALCGACAQFLGNGHIELHSELAV